MGQRFRIDRVFLRGVEATGKYQEFADQELRGFAVKVAPGGTVAYSVRWLKPDGKQGRKVIGYFPAMNPGTARELARKELLLTEKKADTLAERVERRRQRVEAEKSVGMATSLGQFLDGDYGDWLKTHRRSGETMLKRLKIVFAEHLDRPLVEFNAWIVEKWRIARKKTCTVGTVNRELNALKAVFAKAVTWNVIPDHPLRQVKIETDSKRIVRFLSDDEEQALRDALDAREARFRDGRASGNAWRAERGRELMPERTEAFVDHLKPSILLTMNTGLRRGELLSLRWADVDLERAILTVRAANAKTEKDRHVPLNDEALATLKAWKKQAHPDIVFAGRDDAPLTDLKTAWHKLLAAASIKDFRWHDQRHHFASRLVMEGVDLNTVRELMGHADLKMTLRYAHLAPEHKAAAVAKLNRARPAAAPKARPARVAL